MHTIENTSSYKVSVVIPAYNAGQYLARTLDSVLAQTREAREIIVVDDGSTDNTREVAGQYTGRIRYIYQENGGASAARNTGIRAAQNEWIALLDGDDEWLPENLEQQMELLERNRHLDWTAANFYICHCRENRKQIRLDTQQGKRLLGDTEFFEDYFAAFRQGAAGWTGTMIIRKELLRNAGLFRIGQPVANDLDMWWRIAYLRPCIGYYPAPLAVYHCQISDSITKKYTHPKYLSDLLARHLQLAAAAGRLSQFEPCAEHFLRYWIHTYLQDGRIVNIRDFIVRFDQILPSGYKSLLRLLTIAPRTTLACRPILSRLNRFLRLPI